MSTRDVAASTGWDGWSWYWMILCGAWFVGFLPVELWALWSGRPQDTLSAQVWRVEQFLPGQSIVDWTAMHFLIGAGIAVVLLWLIGHFTFGIWR